MKRLPSQRRSAGYMLTEILLTLALTSIVVAGLLQVMVTHSRVYSDQDLGVAMQQNLRVGMDNVLDAFRNAGYGVPRSNLAAWVSWAPGFATNPLVTQGVSAPDTLSFAACFRGTLARLNTNAATGATALPLTSEIAGSAVADLFGSGAKSLIVIGESQWARVTSVSGSTLTIDTDLAAADLQGLAKKFPQGTPVCRVEVWTVAIRNDSGTGIPGLTIDDNLGGGPVEVAQAITDLQVDEITAGKQYRVTLTARTEKPLSGQASLVTESLRSLVTLKN